MATIQSRSLTCHETVFLIFLFVLASSGSLVFIDSQRWHMLHFRWQSKSSSPGSSDETGVAAAGQPRLGYQDVAAHDSDAKGSSHQSVLLPEMRSLRRIETGLRQARAALKRAAAASEKMNGSSSSSSRALQADVDVDEVEPRGAVYKNAILFQQSYMEMEKRFKVFIYTEGEKPLVHDGPCKDIYSTEGRFIHTLQQRQHNPFVTTDPYLAHAFFLPFSVSKMVSYLYDPLSFDMSPLLHFAMDYVHVISSKHPFWNRSHGADHFMLSCHDWGPHISRSHPELEKNAIRVLCNANSSEGFLPDKDASLPEINMVGGYIPQELGGPAMKERPYLAFFAGREHGPVRPILFKHWEGKGDGNGGVKVFHELSDKALYQDYMKKSRFCLCPGGFEVNSPRIVEAIYNDCIPVIIADGFVLPFSDVLDWDAFSVKVMEEEIPNLKSVLEAVPLDRCEQMQNMVRLVRRHFLFHKPPRRYDLFHMILHSVWLRRLNFRLHFHRSH